MDLGVDLGVDLDARLGVLLELRKLAADKGYSNCAHLLMVAYQNSFALAFFKNN